MDNITLLNNSVLLEEKAEDFIDEIILEEDKALRNDIYKRKLTLIGLGSLYVVLLLASFTFLT